jgi:NDP-sugar pyrophosphorylase family protein
MGAHPCLDAVVLCGGRGTRLGALTTTMPKPLLPVAGEPFLLRLMRRLRAEGCGRFVLASHYRAEAIRAFLAQHAAAFPESVVVEEPEPLGTGGALHHAAEAVGSAAFVVVNGDSWVEQPLAPVVEAHTRAGWPMTVVAVRADRVIGGARDKARCDIGPDGRLRGFVTEAQVREGWVNGGMYVLDRSATRRWPEGGYSLEQRLLELVPGGPGVVPSEGWLLDIGTPDCYEAAVDLLAVAPAEAAPAVRNG